MSYASVSNVSHPAGVVIKVMLERGAGKEPEMRRIRGSFRFEELVSVVRNMWNSAPKRLTLEYVDDEGDRVRIGSDLEWEEAMQQHSDVQAALKLYARRGRHSKKADGRIDDDSSDNEEVVTEAARAAAVATAPRVPPLAVGALSSETPDVEEAAETEESAPEQDSRAEAGDATPQQPAEAAAARDADVTIELLSRLYDCDAAKEMLDMFTRVDFSPVVTRRVDAVAQEIHVDVDKIALRHLTVTRTNLWIGNGLYEKAEATLEAALKVWPNDSVLEYNTACAASLRGELDKSLAYLRLAVAHGYHNAAQVKRDPDLAHVREHPDFGALLASMQNTSAESSSHTRSSSVSEPAPAAHPLPATAPVTPDAAAVPPADSVRQETDVDRLLAVFPHLTVAEATGLMSRFGSLAVAVNFLLNQI